VKYCAVLLFLLSFASFSIAETLEFVFSDFPPYEYTENGSATGINKEIIEEACSRLDVTPVFIQLPWKRALQYAKEGTANAVFSLFKNDDRMRYYNFPKEHINTVKMVLVTNRESNIEINSIEDMKSKRVGIYLGSSYGEKFDRNDQIVKDPATTNESLLRKQAAKRTDFAIIDERVAKYWCKKNDMEGTFRILDYIVTENNTYVAFSKATEKVNGKDIASKFSTVLKEMKAEGFIEEVNAKYMFCNTGNH
jgi:polar amino acid transport system substrate-binding protein